MVEAAKILLSNIEEGLKIEGYFTVIKDSGIRQREL